jgi:hypothetical protein
MKLVCASCQNQIPAEDINLDMAIAKCRRCDSVFSFLDTLAPAKDSVAPGEAMLPVPMPKRFKIEEWGKDLAITFRWFTPVSLFLVFFCLFWDCFLIVWYFIGFGIIFGGKGEPAAIMMVLFPIIHVAVGLGLTYFTIATFVNTTVIRLVGGELSVLHGPLPWYGNLRLRAADVRQVYCTENHQRRKNGGESVTFTVNLLRQDQSKAMLLSYLTDMEEALYVQQKLRESLGLGDEHVAGAIRA